MFYLVALGSNLGDRLAHMQSAVHAFSCLPGTEVVRVSGVYETAPVGCTDDNVYLNAAVLLQSRLAPGEMLGACLGVEASRGRRRPYVNAPRVLDCDLIFAFDGEREVRVNTPNLTLPHPRFLARRFVLQPLFTCSRTAACLACVIFCLRSKRQKISSWPRPAVRSFCRLRRKTNKF